jgi:hypothetical protein
MKKYLLGMIAVVVAIGFSAFTSVRPIASKTDSVKQTSFYWFAGSAYDGFKTKSAEMTASGCNDVVTPICRNGYNADDLVDPAHPELGVKSGAVADATIKRTT